MALNYLTSQPKDTQRAKKWTESLNVKNVAENLVRRGYGVTIMLPRTMRPCMSSN